MVRYPDPAVQVLEPASARLRVTSAAVERLATGFRWAERLGRRRGRRRRGRVLCFGGIHRNRLFMAASQSLYSLYVEAQGAIGG